VTSRTAFITGASRGIGLACANLLAENGHTVVLAARNLEKLEEAAAAIRAKGGTAHVVAVDLSDADSIKAAFAQAVALAGPIHILVNNAGVTKDGLALRMKPEDWNSVLQTNLTGSFLCIQAAMQGMMKERWGRIINIASVVGEMGNAGQANYVASKAGLIGLTKSLAQELASRNITVNAVTPGFISTDMTAVLNDEQKGKMLGLIPLKRFGEPGDIAAAVAFLASDGASYITGNVLRVNGGMYM
jgi:3-oxoacyl-[acyl-carrier protein] reductase